jgi:hypothetical protein
MIDVPQVAEASDTDAIARLVTDLSSAELWFRYVVTDGVDISAPGIYQWQIEGSGTYIGKFKQIGRPTKEYGRNVLNILRQLPYRRGNHGGFRRIHIELEKAHREKRQITLTILENVHADDINQREQALIRERGTLNEPQGGAARRRQTVAG